MHIFVKLAAGAAAIGLAAPAIAQTAYPYPQYQYPQQTYPQYYPQQAYPSNQYPQQTQPHYPYPSTGYGYPGQPGYGQQNSIGQLINQLLGNRYTVTDRTAVTQCAAAAQAQAAAQYQPRGGYGQYQGAPYGHAYGHNAMPAARVTGITNVERRNNGLRVTGLMSSGIYGNQGYNPAYANRQSDLTFRCNVDYRGAVTNLRVSRNSAYRR